MTKFDVSGTPLDVIHDFLASMAVDQQIEGGQDAGARRRGER